MYTSQWEKKPKLEKEGGGIEKEEGRDRRDRRKKESGGRKEGSEARREGGENFNRTLFPSTKYHLSLPSS